MSTIAWHSTLNISETVRDRRLVPKEYGLSNGNVTDDVTGPTTVLWGSTVGYPSDSLASCSLGCEVKVRRSVNFLNRTALTYLLMSVNGTMFVFSVYDLGVLVYACLLDRQESISWSRSWNQTGYVLWHYLFLAVRHSRIHTVTEWYRKKSLKCMTSSINPESTSMSRNAWSIRRPTNRCQTARCSHNRRTVLYDTSHDTLTLLFDG